MNFFRRAFWTNFFVVVISMSSAVSADANLLWPIECEPEDGTCFSTLGYPDADGDGIAHDCEAPDYLDHEGTDISVYSSAVEPGVDVLAAEEGEVLYRVRWP